MIVAFTAISFDTGNFHNCNLALLAKWVWQFVTEHDALWRHLIVAKHRLTGRVWPTVRYYGLHLSLWRFICQSIGLIADPAQRCIGDGSPSCFWIDSWLSCGIISTTFPCLFRLARHLDDTMVDVWSAGTEAWDLRLRRNLNDLEISEWASFFILSLISC